MELEFSERAVPVVELEVVNTTAIQAKVARRWEVICARNAYVDGPMVAEFEEAWADYVGADWCVAVGNGTDALELACRALWGGVTLRGVSIPALTFVGTAEAAVRAGENLIVCDVDEATLLAPNTSISVGLYGQPIEGPAIIDAAQMHGIRTGGQLAAWSFYPTKNLGCFGDGGAVTTSDENLADEIRSIARHGWLGEQLGFNSRLDSMQAAVLLEKLPHLDGWVAQRREAAETYRVLLEDIGLPLYGGADSVFHLAVTRVRQRWRVIAAMAEQGIATGVHYTRALSMLPWLTPYRVMPTSGPECPRAELAAEEVLTLPLWPGIDPRTIERVVETLGDVLDDLEEQ